MSLKKFLIEYLNLKIRESENRLINIEDEIKQDLKVKKENFSLESFLNLKTDREKELIESIKKIKNLKKLIKKISI